MNCCDTGKLSRTFSNDWSKNDNETWENSKLGACKTASFDPCKGLDVSVKKKSGKDSLKVSKLTLDLNKPNEKSSTARQVIQYKRPNNKIICPLDLFASTTMLELLTLSRGTLVSWTRAVDLYHVLQDLHLQPRGHQQQLRGQVW